VRSRSKKIKTVFYTAIFLMFLLHTTTLFAEDPPVPKEVKEGKCPNGFPTNLITDFCYKCFFPIKIGGHTVFKYGGIPDPADASSSNLKDAINNFFSSAQASNQLADPNVTDPKDFNPSSVVCFCKDSLGLPRPGIYISFWEPARIAEAIYRNGCFPTLFGAQINFGGIDFGAHGDNGGGEEHGERNTPFWNIHMYAFPLIEILSIAKDMDWCTDWISKFDLINMSEIDPTHNDEIISAFISPEMFLFANPIAQLLCSVDSVTSSLGYPLNVLFWCAGTWGSLYPLSGYDTATNMKSQAVVSNLVIAKNLFKLGRIVLELNTSGEGAKCGTGQKDWVAKMYMPILKKSQYRFQTLFPIPETKGKCCHVIGAHSFLWGEWRNNPIRNYYQYMIWRKRNCCLKFL